MTLLLQGDAYEVMRILPSRSVNQIATSPPYWGLRITVVVPARSGEKEASKDTWNASGKCLMRDGGIGGRWDVLGEPGR